MRDGPSRIEQRLIHFGDIAARHWGDVRSARPRDDEPRNYFATHDVGPGDWLLGAGDVEAAVAAHRNIDFADIAAEESPWPVFPLAAQSFQSVPSQFAAYVELIRERLRKGHRVMIVCDNNGQVMRLDELLRAHERPAMALEQSDRFTRRPDSGLAAAPEVQLAIGELHEGFHCPPAEVFIVTDREIFGRYKRRHIYRRGFRGKAVASPTEIKRGDYVVHMSTASGY